MYFRFFILGLFLFFVGCSSVSTSTPPLNYTGTFSGTLTSTITGKQSDNLEITIVNAEKAYSFFIRNVDTNSSVFSGDCAPTSENRNRFLCFSVFRDGIWNFDGLHSGSSYSGTWEAIGVDVDDKGTFFFAK